MKMIQKSNIENKSSSWQSGYFNSLWTSFNNQPVDENRYHPFVNYQLIFYQSRSWARKYRSAASKSRAWSSGKFQ